MARERKFPSGATLIALLKSEPMLTRRDLMMLYGVQGPCVDRNCRRVGAWPSKHGKPAYFEADIPAPVTPAPNKKVTRIEARIRKMHRDNPYLTANDVRDAFGVSRQTACRAIRSAGIKLRSSLRRLPHDARLVEEIKMLGQRGVAERYGVSVSSVSQHAARLGLRPTRKRSGPSPHRRLPPDDVMIAEFGLFTPREIATRHGVSYQSVLEARVRLDVPAQSARMPHALVPSGMTSIVTNAIAHLSAYRATLATSDPPRAQALLADIEQLGAVATTIRTIATMVAEPSRIAS